MTKSSGLENRATLDLLINISKELTSDLDLRTVLARSLSLACSALGAERASIIVLDEKGQPLDAAMVVGSDQIPSTAAKLRSLIRKGLAGWVLRSGLPALVTDTSTDERWLARPDDSLGDSGSKSVMCVPIVTRGKPVGVFTIVHPEANYFAPSHLSLLVSIAEQAGIAIYNARLHGQVQTAQRRYRQLFDDSLDMIFLTDRSGTYREMNQRASALVPHRGRALNNLKIPSLLNLDEKWLEAQTENLRRGSTLRFEGLFFGREKDGLPVEVYLRPLAIDGEDSLQWIMRDISSRRSLESLREMLSECVMHDLRAPLANIRSSLDLMTLAGGEHESADRELAAVARRSSERMLHLINSFLDLSHLEAGQALKNKRPLKMAPILREAVEHFKPALEEKKQVLKASFAQKLAPVQGDREMLLRVFMNLLDNAIKFSPAGGKLAITAAAHPEGRLVVEVEDSGAGIPREEWGTVFDKYYRVSSTSPRSGYGLGLAFCRLAVEAHGGTIHIDASSLGGSRFTVHLPEGNK